jgi:hypothetical protein
MNRTIPDELRPDYVGMPTMYLRLAAVAETSVHFPRLQQKWIYMGREEWRDVPIVIPERKLA